MQALNALLFFLPQQALPSRTVAAWLFILCTTSGVVALICRSLLTYILYIELLLFLYCNLQYFCKLFFACNVLFIVVTIFFRRYFLPPLVTALVALSFNNSTQWKHVCPGRVLACTQIPLVNVVSAPRASDIVVTCSTYPFTLVIKSVTKAAYQLHSGGVLTSFIESLRENCYSWLLERAVGCSYYFIFHGFLITALLKL